MANKEKIDYLLLDIRELETLVAGMRDAEVYPVSFFGQTFDLTHKILKEFHALEAAQIEMLRKQMEEHQALIQSIPPSVAVPISATTAPIIEQVIEEVVIETPQEEIPVEEVVTTLPEPQLEPESESASEPVIEPAPPVVEPALSVEEMPHKAAASERTGLFLNDLLEKKNLSDFRKAFSLNDRFRFRRELFGGDESRMNKAINDLNELHSYEDSVTYLNHELKWNIEDEAVADFIKLLEKRFL